MSNGIFLPVLWLTCLSSNLIARPHSLHNKLLSLLLLNLLFYHLHVALSLTLALVLAFVLAPLLLQQPQPLFWSQPQQLLLQHRLATAVVDSPSIHHFSSMRQDRCSFRYYCRYRSY